MTVHTLAEVFEPADSGAAGKLLSPRRTSTWVSGTRSRSAAVCAKMVYAPVPMSLALVSTSTCPSGVSVTRQLAGAICVGYIDEAHPQPICQGPSFIDRGAASRRCQPKASAAASKHGISERLENGTPLMLSVCVSLRRRSSMGSSSSAYDSSSIADSRANRYGVSGGARMNPGVCRSAVTLCTRASMFAQPYRRYRRVDAGDGEPVVARGDLPALVAERPQLAVPRGAELHLVLRLGAEGAQGEALLPAHHQLHRSTELPARRRRRAPSIAPAHRATRRRRR